MKNVSASVGIISCLILSAIYPPTALAAEPCIKLKGGKACVGDWVTEGEKSLYYVEEIRTQSSDEGYLRLIHADDPSRARTIELHHKDELSSLRKGKNLAALFPVGVRFEWSYVTNTGLFDWPRYKRIHRSEVVVSVDQTNYSVTTRTTQRFPWLRETRTYSIRPNIYDNDDSSSMPPQLTFWAVHCERPSYCSPLLNPGTHTHY